MGGTTVINNVRQTDSKLTAAAAAGRCEWAASVCSESVVELMW